MIKKTKLADFVVLSFPNEEFAKFAAALGAVINLDDLQDYIGGKNADFLYDFEEAIFA